MRTATKISGCYLLDSSPYVDHRGSLLKPIKSEFPPVWHDQLPVREVFFSTSVPNVFRGMHLQLPPHGISKTVICVQGQIMDFVIDLRSDSPSYLQTLSIDLSSDPHRYTGIVVPIGCAHGFYVPDSTATVLYLQSGTRAATHESGVNVNYLVRVEPILQSCILSDRDKELPDLNHFPQISEKEWRDCE
jgi:dTDP-4-dehydrorhamnose 3,5-epimerase-like enzyme